MQRDEIGKLLSTLYWIKGKKYAIGYYSIVCLYGEDSGLHDGSTYKVKDAWSMKYAYTVKDAWMVKCTYDVKMRIW